MKPIIQSLLDLDFYKLTMAQLAWRLHREVPVRYGFTNRTKKVRIADTVPIEVLRDELAHVRTLRPTAEEIGYLRESRHVPRGLFGEDFLKFFEGVRLPEVEIETTPNGQYRLETAGSWPEAIFWETIVLCVVNELYYRFRSWTERADPAAVRREGDRRLGEKIALLKARPEALFIEFGTRRRYSAENQALVTERLADEAPWQIIGTSNVHLAKRFGLAPKGTMAHETFMIYAGICGATDVGLRDSHNRVLRDWWDLYGAPMSLALTDTYGSGFFFRDFTPEQARSWKGLRQDSGDPFAFGERQIAFYEGLGIDARGKLFVPSDGLDMPLFLKLVERFSGRIQVCGGIGTNLSNDVGYPSLSLVMKAIEAGGRPLVKLSDNPAKATGPAGEVGRYKRVFAYEEGVYQECKS